MTQSQLRIIDEITSRIAVSRIYQIGHRQYVETYDGIYQQTKRNREHFDLLVVVDGICNREAFNIQKSINSSSNIGISVSLWIHSGASIEEFLYDKRSGHFFHEILKSEKLIYKMPDDPEFDVDTDINALNRQGNLDEIWARGYSKAKALLHAASTLDENDNEEIKLWLMRQAMKQLCLAFIFKMIGYKPSQHSLSYLFNICRCITPVFDEVFPREGMPAHKLFKTQKISILHQRCKDWMERAKEVVMQGS